MADWGLIGGLAQGLQSGFDSYMRERKSQDENRYKNLALALQARQTGAMLDPSGNSWQNTPERQAELDQKRGLLDPTSKQSASARLPYKSAFEQYGIKPEGLLTDDMSASDIKEREDLFKTLISGKQQERLKYIENQNKPPKLTKDKELFVEGMGKKVTEQTAILNIFDQLINQLDDAKLSPKDKHALILEQAKLLNSQLGSDALGGEEVKRVLSYLQTYDPLGPKGFLEVGPNVPKAIEMIKLARNRVAGGIDMGQKQIQSVMGTGASGYGPKTQQIQTQAPKIVIQNGNKFRILPNGQAEFVGPAGN